MKKSYSQNLYNCIPLYTILLLNIILVMGNIESSTASTFVESNNKSPFLVVLGIAQDGGYPQAGCQKTCCASAWENSEQRRHVSCIAIIDPETSQRWIAAILSNAQRWRV